MNNEAINGNVSAYVTALRVWAQKARVIAEYESGLRTTLEECKTWRTQRSLAIQNGICEGLPTKQQLSQALEECSRAETSAQTLWNQVPADVQRFLKSPDETRALLA